MSSPSDTIGLLNDDEIVRLLDDLVRDDGRVDREELRISCCDGEITLEGALPSEQERDIVLALLRDEAGIERIVDRIEVERVAWERPDRAPGLEAESLDAADELPEAAEEEPTTTTEPIQALTEGTPYTPPDRPIPLPRRDRLTGRR